MAGFKATSQIERASCNRAHLTPQPRVQSLGRGDRIGLRLLPNSVLDAAVWNEPQKRDQDENGER